MAFSSGWRGAALVIGFSFVLVGGTGLFFQDNRPAATVSALNVSGLTTPVATSSGAGNVDDRIAALAARLRHSPNDAEGWRLLGWSYFNTQRYKESAEAYARAVALDPDNTGMQSAQAEAVVQAAGGQVTPPALASFESVLLRDPEEHRSRFYVALAKEQAGDLSHALDLWRELLDSAPADAGWRASVISHVSELAARTGRSAAMVPADISNGASLHAGIQALPEPGQQAMIRGMVDGLEVRLASSPHDAEGWLRLIRSRMVLNEPGLAHVAFRAAMAEFSADPSVRQRFTDLAQSLGLTVD